MYPIQESDADYFASGAYGSTVAKAALISPQKARDVIDGRFRHNTSALNFGTLWDTYTTGDRSSVIMRPDTYEDAKTGAIKEWHHSSTVCKAWHAEHANHIIAKKEDFERAVVMWERMPAKLRSLVEACQKQAVYRHTVGDIFAQCKVDLLRHDVLSSEMIDIKTTSSPIEEFDRQAMKYGYHVQAGWYRWIVKAATGESLPFSFIVTETVSPFRTVHFRPDDNWLAYADIEAARALAILSHPAATGDWSDKKPITQTLTLPHYISKGLSNA